MNPMTAESIYCLNKKGNLYSAVCSIFTCVIISCLLHGYVDIFNLLLFFLTPHAIPSIYITLKLIYIAIYTSLIKLNKLIFNEYSFKKSDFKNEKVLQTRPENIYKSILK